MDQEISGLTPRLMPPYFLASVCSGPIERYRDVVSLGLGIEHKIDVKVFTSLWRSCIAATYIGDP